MCTVASLILMLLLMRCPAPAQTQRARPNIVLIVLDDLDYHHVGAYGATGTLTPNIDALAATGVRYTQFYTAAPVCSPSRIGLMTGVSPATFGIHKAFKAEDDKRGVPAEFEMLPEALDGYTTAHIGKWHMGEYREEFRPEYRYDFTDITQSYSIQDSYATNYVADRAIDYIRSLPEPYFISVQFLAPHRPLHIPPDFNNACCGFDLETERGKLAAMLYVADAEIGRIVGETGDNTLIIITSDNGGVPDVTWPGRWLRNGKGSLYEGGIRVPFVAYWPGVVEPGSANDDVVSALDVLPALASGTLPERHTGSLFWEFKPQPRYQPGNTLDFALRRGDWKLIGTGGRLELYNIANDPGEQNDLATRRPLRVKRFYRQYLDWRRGVGDLSTQAEGGAIPFEVRHDFHNGDFSAVVHFDGPGSVERPGSWRLATDGEQVSLRVDGDYGGETLLSGPVTFPATVMFTTTGYKAGTNHFQLYVNGERVDEDHESVVAVASTDSDIVMSGEVEVKRLSVLALAPEEVNWQQVLWLPGLMR